jgi:hypothetical protein
MLQMMRVLHANRHKSKPERSKNGTICENEVKASGPLGEAGQVTRSRLQGTAVENSRAGAATMAAPTPVHNENCGVG